MATDNYLIARSKKQQDLLDRRAKLLRIQSQEQKFKKLLSVDSWKSACLKAGFSSFQMLLKDPTGVSQQLSAYHGMTSYGNAFAWKKKACLTKLAEQLEKAKITYQAKTDFCAYIKQVCEAEVFETNRLMVRLFNDIIEGKDKQHLSAYRLFAKKEFNEPNLDFVLDAQAALSKNKKESDRNKRFGAYDEIIDKFSLRGKTSSDINVDDKLRLAFVQAWDNANESECESLLVKMVDQVWAQCYGETFVRYWFANGAVSSD